MILARAQGAGKVDKQCSSSDMSCGGTGEFLRLSPVFEVFVGAFAACGVFFKGLIYFLELWAVDGPWHASTYMLELLPSVCWVHLQPDFELPWQVCLGLLRPMFVVVQQWEWLPLGAGGAGSEPPPSKVPFKGGLKGSLPGRGGGTKVRRA